MPRPLPPEFQWHPVQWELYDSGRRILTVGGPDGVEIVLVRERVDGPKWTASINRHLPWERRAYALHPHREHAMRMASRWAAANAPRILAEIAARRHRLRPDGMIQAG